MSSFQAIINNLKNVINLPDSHFYDLARSDELSRNITNGKAEYPAILVIEAEMYSPITNQDGIDLKNEIRTGTHVEKDNYDGELYLYSDGSAYFYSSGTEVFCSWDVGKMWSASAPSDVISFEAGNGFLTLHLPDNVSWIFQKVY